MLYAYNQNVFTIYYQFDILEIYGGFMKRHLFFVMLVIFILMYMVINQTYLNRVSETRTTLKSNGKYPEAWQPITGRIMDYDLEKKTFDLKIWTGEKWRIKLKDVQPLEELISKHHYDVSLYVDVNQHQYLSAKNKAGFDYDRYLYSQNIVSQYYGQDLDTQENTKSFSISKTRLIIRQWILKTLKLGFDSEDAGFLSALILGDKSEFEDFDQYKNLGLAHIFAISGLHFNVIFAFVKKLMPFQNRFLKSLMMLSVMTFIMLLVGEAYSAQRAYFMIFYAELCYVLYKKSDIYMSLAFSVFMILILQPKAILSTGMYLSYYAYICVAILYRLCFKTSSKSKLFEALRFSIAIQIMLLPATLYFFHSSNVYGFISNIFIVPLSSVILVMAILMLMLKAFGLDFLFYGTVVCIRKIIEIFEALTTLMPLKLNVFSLINNVDFINVLYVLIIFSFSLTLWRVHINRKSILLKCIVIFLFFSIAQQFRFQKSSFVTFYDVGHGDMSLIKMQETTVLIDTGDGKNSAQDILRSNGIQELDYLILSHAHQDHIGGTLELLDNMEVEHLIVNQSTWDKLVENNIEFDGDLMVITEQGYEIISKDQDVKLDIQPMVGEGAKDDPNDDAIVVKLEYGAYTGYFLGDISKNLLKEIDQGAVSFVKTPHHGSKTALDASFYARHDVLYAFTSCSIKYNMPHKDVVSMLLSEGVEHYTTYERGQVDLTFSNQQIKIKSYLE